MDRIQKQQYNFGISQSSLYFFLPSLINTGQHSVQWLGRFENLASCKEFMPDKVYSDEEKKSPFPVRPHDKRSYSQSCVVWIKPSGLQVSLNHYLSDPNRHASCNESLRGLEASLSCK